MPQMAPYNWLNMFMLFNFINLMIISINYFMSSPHINYINKKINYMNKFNLKW